MTVEPFCVIIQFTFFITQCNIHILWTHRELFSKKRTPRARAFLRHPSGPVPFKATAREIFNNRLRKLYRSGKVPIPRDSNGIVFRDTRGCSLTPAILKEREDRQRSRPERAGQRERVEFMDFPRAGSPGCAFSGKIMCASGASKVGKLEMRLRALCVLSRGTHFGRCGPLCAQRGGKRVIVREMKSGKVFYSKRCRMARTLRDDEVLEAGWLWL